MTKRLVIAEKPSVGISIAAVLGVKDRKDGYIEGFDYIVSWGFGHLAELANADTYDEKYAKWRYDDLPIIPANWKYKIPRDKYSQFETLKKLMNRADVSDVINACDAGREGELIFRNIYKMTGCKKPVYRLWISSMEDSTIEQGFRELKDGKEYDNLFAAARCREWADWLVGINATRLFSVLYHRTLNVGRVVSPTLALLVQREAEIEAFKPEPFYTAELNFGAFIAVSEKFKKKSEAEAVIPKDNEPVTVKSVTSKEKTEKAAALYDLTTLQRDANRQLGYTAQQTLDYVQSLYEKKLCTYPRTDSRYLTDDMADGVNAIVICSAGICNEAAPSVVLPKQICNSKKVSDHHAIIPTLVAGETDIGTLPIGEREIIKLIAKQVLRAVSESYRFRETVAVLSCGNRNRTAGSVRHHFDKYGGNLGANGCVSWSFDKKGVLVIDNEDGDYEEDQVMMDAMDCGADDFEADGDVFTVYTTPDDFNAVADALAAKKYSFVSAQIEMVPQNYVKLSAEDAEKMEKMLELFDDDDDVQNTWHNWDQD